MPASAAFSQAIRDDDTRYRRPFVSDLRSCCAADDDDDDGRAAVVPRIVRSMILLVLLLAGGDERATREAMGRRANDKE